MAVAGAQRFKNYIGGEWVDASGGETFESIVPANGEPIGEFPRSTPEDVDRAVAAAKEAFVSGLHTIFVVAAVIAFAGSVLALLLVRDRDIEPEPVGEPETRPEPGVGPLAA